MSSSPYPSLKDLTAAMSGIPCTEGWDIVCSFEIASLNAFLASQYGAGKLAKEVNLSTTVSDPLTAAESTLEYHVKLGSPTIGFIAGQSGVVSVSMPIEEGSSYRETRKGDTAPTVNGDIPAGTYVVRAVVPLAAVNGETGAISEQGTVVTFSETAVHQNAVIIHFQSAGSATYTITPPPQNDHDALATYFLPLLRQHFQTQVSTLDYVLAAVNNQKPPSGGTVLTPSAFVFATSGGGDAGVLSLYLQTLESGNPAGERRPSFQAGGSVTLPIPATHTASIILSNSLITRGVIKPQLEAAGFTVSFLTPSDGISAQVKADMSVIADARNGSIGYAGYKYEGLTLSLKDNPLGLVLRQGSLSLEWSGRTTSSWYEYTNVGSEPGGTVHNGIVRIAVDLNMGPFPLSVSDSGIAIASVTPATGDFIVAPLAQSCTWYEILFGGCRESVPRFYTHEMKLQIPTINIALHGLNYFAAANLLAPGAHLIQVDSAAGVQTPHDLLVVGHVAQAPPRTPNSAGAAASGKSAGKV